MQALTRVNASWHLLVTDLESISGDSTFPDATRAAANGISIRIKGKRFLLILNFVIDALQELSYWSKQLQRKAATLINMGQFHKKILQTFETLKSKYGASVNNFLDKVECFNQESVSRKCSSTQFYASASKVVWQTVELQNDRNVPFIDDIKQPFLNSLLDEINSYFPEGELTDFMIFVPQHWSQSVTSLKTYGQDEIKRFSSKFQLPPQTVAAEWKDIIIAISKQDDFCRYQKSDAIYFWSHYLQVENIPWKENIKTLLMTILVLPIGSADAERGFSIMNHIRTNRRASLAPETIDAMMRIRINGPNNLENFKAELYSKQWVDQNHMKSDALLRLPKKRKLEDTNAENDDNNDAYKTYLKQSRLF